jgi:hypothetical protein
MGKKLHCISCINVMHVSVWRLCVNGPNKPTISALKHISLGILDSLTYNFLCLLFTFVSHTVFVDGGTTGERLKASSHGATEEQSW